MFIVDITWYNYRVTIVNGVYKPTYNWAAFSQEKSDIEPGNGYEREGEKSW